ncbi:MAG: bifunctional diaminohydroxyphosphoribosylaminopyrimidine deaminase/5-amino-6-(5-phosphoribosylamino)uracil reductase RibD [Agathobacter sp.]|nr:bifunctional diaminohydroxyphosphoribosylaminopyrimidine deaminase/5-amino-6-(5-phosphoribosylamino)uracil reductase RibD [Agathobacter sp.]
MTDIDYMKRAIQLAKKGQGFTNPNPMVGAVIVKDGRIIGEGYHKKYKELHAERNAIASLKEDAKGSTMYVTLEPCCHYGKTPPCTEAIIENGISKVVIGSRDPNPLVAGKGVKILREHGIEVVCDFLKEECDKLNPVFFHYIITKKPYVTMKYAMTCDGKIATKNNDSKWITGENSRNEVHKMRHNNMGIVAGIGTVLADNPMLNVRIEGLKSPIRIICDSNLRIPMESEIVKTANKYKTIIAYVNGDSDKINALEEEGLILQKFSSKDGKVDLNELMQYLGEQNIDSIFVEGGANLNDSFMREGLVNRLEVFVAPKVFGGADARSPIEGMGVDFVSEAKEFSLENVRRIDEDILLSYVAG